LRIGHGLLLACLWYIKEVDVATLLLAGSARDRVLPVDRGEVLAAASELHFVTSSVSPAS
jgi:hypothetical protein